MSTAAETMSKQLFVELVKKLTTDEYIHSEQTMDDIIEHCENVSMRCYQFLKKDLVKHFKDIEDAEEANKLGISVEDYQKITSLADNPNRWRPEQTTYIQASLPFREELEEYDSPTLDDL